MAVVDFAFRQEAILAALVLPGAWYLGQSWAETALLIGVVVSTFGYLSGMALAVPRALYAFARDGFLPSPIASVHPTWKTPHIAIALQLAVTCTLAITSGFGPLAIIANVAALLVYFACAVAALELRRRNVQAGGIPFRVPGAGGVPIRACVVIVGLLTSITMAEWSSILVTAAVALLAAKGEAARLLGLAPPPEQPLDLEALSPLARRFYAESKRVANARAKAERVMQQRMAEVTKGLPIPPGMKLF